MPKRDSGPDGTFANDHIAAVADLRRIPRRRGRPTAGMKVEVRIPPDVLAIIDAEAAERGVTRSAHLREIIVRPYAPTATTNRDDEGRRTMKNDVNP
jgi:hypothetical protein